MIVAREYLSDLLLHERQHIGLDKSDLDYLCARVDLHTAINRLIDQGSISHDHWAETENFLCGVGAYSYTVFVVLCFIAGELDLRDESFIERHSKRLNLTEQKKQVAHAVLNNLPKDERL